MDPTQAFIADLENMSAEDVRAKFFDLFNQALAIGDEQEEQESSSASSGQEPASNA